MNDTRPIFPKVAKRGPKEAKKEAKKEMSCGCIYERHPHVLSHRAGCPLTRLGLRIFLSAPF